MLYRTSSLTLLTSRMFGTAIAGRTSSTFWSARSVYLSWTTRTLWSWRSIPSTAPPATLRSLWASPRSSYIVAIAGSGTEHTHSTAWTIGL
ncbi:hypothetical protein C8T65DRAFT_630958 [Cerioporus squamosus]|nr:hypothetical protein C8T65DRAFT_630958 [Cerioporus squamosus]